MKRVITFVLLIVLLTPNIFAESIKSFNTEIKINTDGTINVEETILYDFEKDYKHGIYRDIPYIKTNLDGEDFKMNIDDIVVVDDKGRTYTISISDTGKDINIRIGDADKTITGQHHYVIKYKVSGALTYFEDFDELYWNLTGNNWDIPIHNFNSTVTLPNDTSNISSICYTGYMGGSNEDCNTIVNNNVVEISSTKILSPKEGITVAITFPKGIVDVLEPTSTKAPLWIIGIFILLGVSFYILLPAFVLFKFFQRKRFVKRNQKIVAAWFDPPKYVDGKKLTPIETHTLVKQSIGGKQITATLLDLAHRGYIKIEAKSKKDRDILFKKLKDFGNLNTFEKKLLNAMFVESDDPLIKNLLGKLRQTDTKKDSNEVTLKDIKKNVLMADAITKVKDDVFLSLYKNKFFSKNIKNAKTMYYVFIFLSLMFGNIPLFLTLLICSTYPSKMTLLGVEKYSEALSLKNFLVSQNEQFDFQAKEQMFFEKLLPYATAFGVEDIWQKRFGDIDIKNPDWYEGDLASLAIVTSSINRGINSSVNYARSSSGFSSGSSGGFSGGGGGGGGGGSW